MQVDPKSGDVTASLEQIAYYNMFLVEAIFELLAEKGLITGEQVKERVKKLQAETRLVFRHLQ